MPVVRGRYEDILHPVMKDIWQRKMERQLPWRERMVRMFSRYDSTDWVMLSLAMAVVLFILLCLVALSATVVANTRCLDAGYLDARVTWDFRAYCHKQGNLGETIIVPLHEIERQ